MANNATTKQPYTVRMWNYVNKTDTCWLWTGRPANSDGYGRIFVTKYKAIQAHRAIYEAVRGPIPEGLQLDHLCRNRICVNPDHLEPVAGRVNYMRGVSPAAQNARKTHCKRGHELTEANRRVQPRSRKWEYRGCRECLRMTQRAWRARQKEKAHAG